MLQLPMIEQAGQNTFFYETLHKGVGDILAQRYFGGKLKWDIEVEIWELPVGGTEGSHIHDDTEPEYGAIDVVSSPSKRIVCLGFKYGNISIK